MKVEYINPFLKAIFGVLGVLSSDCPERGTLSMRSVDKTKHQVTIVLDVSGDITGKVLYGMSGVTAQKVAYAMLDQPLGEMNEAAWDAIQELGNVLKTGALRHLQSEDVKCDIAEPTMIRGMDIEVSTEFASIVVPVSSRLGRVEVNISVQAPVATKA